MRNLFTRLVASLAVLVVAVSAASAQIQWNVTYEDVSNSSGIGFDSNQIVSGTLTHGQARRDSVQAALNYINTQIDGRGTVNLLFRASQTDATGFLASFGAGQIADINGSFQNGGAYQAARTNTRPFSGSDAEGTFDFGYQWNYAGQTPVSSRYDMVSVAIHEVTHGLGFATFLRPNGAGLLNNTPGSPDVYSGLARYLQRGNGIPGGLFNTNLASSDYGSFTGPVSTLTGGNVATTGLFFGGQYAREVYGGAVPMYAPGTFTQGSSTSHVNDSAAVMNPNIAPNTVRRYLRYEIAMLMDAGWNVYNWDNTGGNWKDGINSDGTFSLTASRWRTDSGIVLADDGSTQYNVNAAQQQAPVLAPYGQVTSNIVLNFGGGGGTPYISSNDLGDIRISRLNLNSGAGAANTINNAASNPNGTLIFGVNQDGTASVLTPKIVQQNVGPFNIDTNILITNTTAAPGSGWTGLTVDGTGTGQVSLGGVVSGNGTLTKSGPFTLQLTGDTANTYTGLTTVQSGTLLLNKTPGQNAIGGSLTITGGTARLGAPDQLPGTGTVTLSGGTLSTGSGTGFGDVVGAFEMTSASTIVLGSGSHTLQFTGFHDASLAGVLTVTGWTGLNAGSGTAGRILFSDVTGDPNSTYSAWLSTVQFQGFSQGAIFLTTGPSGTYELAPVPEPATILGLAFAGLGLGALVRRRRRHLAEAPAIAP